MKKNKKIKPNINRVYRANKKAIIKLILGSLLVFILFVLSGPIINWTKYQYLNTWTSIKFKEYGIELKLPRAYDEQKTIDNNVSSIASSFIKTESNVDINEEYKVSRPDVIYNGGNKLNGVSIMVQAYKTSKTTKTLDEIAEGQNILVEIIYGNDYKMREVNKEYLNLMGVDSVKTTVELKNSSGVKTMINYMIPMDDEEITVTFLGTDVNMSKSIEQIDNIMKRIRRI